MRIKKDELIFLLATRLTWLIILLWGRLTRIKVVGRHHWDWAIRQNRGVIAAMWHGRLLLPTYCHRNQKIIPMVSQHRDGEMIAQTVERLGYKTVRGSSTRGGYEAYQEMLSALNQGKICTIMPDGPKGPRHRLKFGLVLMARQANAIIVPMSFASTKKFKINSWDQFVLWKPFAKSVLMYGEPIEIPRKITKKQVAEYRQLIEARMIALEQKCDGYFKDRKEKTLSNPDGKIRAFQFPRWWLLVLAPLSWLYRAVMRLRNWLYDRKFLSRRSLPVQVISIGNLSVGGTGKTPATQWLAEQLLARGFKVGILSRGYRRASRATVLVSDGQQICASAEMAGDEPLMLASNLPTVPIAVASDRHAGGRFLLEHFTLDLILLDDGFQHRKLNRQLDLVLLDGRRGLRQRVLPAGPFRESVTGLGRADMVWITRSETAEQAQILKQEINQLTSAPVFCADLQVQGIFSAPGVGHAGAELAQKRMLAFCGIANPEHFRQTLVAAGLKPRHFLAYPDHHAYTNKDYTEIRRLAQAQQCEIVMTTQKDFVRLPARDHLPLPVYYLAVNLAVAEPEQAMELIVASINKNSQIFKNVASI